MHEILVLCDTSLEAGLGHFTRTNALVKQLKKIGFSCTWVFSNQTPNYLLQSINSKNEKVIFFNELNEVFLKSLEENSSTLLIDSYQIDDSVRRHLFTRKQFSKIISIQDQAPYKFADVYINHNHSEKKSEVSFLSDNSILFNGSSYLMLDYGKFECIESYDCNCVEKVLVNFGATGQVGLITKTLNILKRLDLKLKVQVSCNAEDYKILKSLKEPSNKNLQIHYSKIDLNNSQKIHEFDVCIGSFGISAWERIYVGLPSVCLPIAENHVDVGKILDRRKVVIFSLPEMLEKNILKLFNDKNLRAKMHAACKEFLDGLSTKRLAIELKQVLGR